MRQKNIKTKGFNEIYFVLYLTALILIIPKSGFEEKPEFEKLPSFFIKSEKTSLTVRLTIQDGKPKIVSADTINFIYTIGEFQDVDYKIKISNNSIERVLFENGERSDVPGFKIKKEGEGGLKFVWDVDSLKLLNKNYNVFVEAEVTPKGTNDKVYTNTRFNLNVLIIDKYPTQIASNNDNQNDLSSLSQDSINSIQNIPSFIRSDSRELLPDVDFSVENPIYSVALTRWSAKIRTYGLNPETDLKSKPKINVESPQGFDNADVRIDNLEERAIEISGNTPSYGKLKIGIEIQRIQDGLKASTEFFVQPLPISPPDYPKTVFPYITYSLDPKFPNQLSSKFEAQLTIDGNIYNTVYGNSQIEFIPVPKDIGKAAYFARYFDGKLIGSKYPIIISEFPSPEITSIKEENGVLRVFTKAYGFTSPGKNNLVEELIVSDKSIDIIDLTGFTEKRDNFTEQVFELRGDNLKGIEIKALDKLNNMSEPRNYPS